MHTCVFNKLFHSKAKVLIFCFSTLLPKIKNPSEKEREIILEKRQWQYYLNPARIDELRPYYADIYDNDADIYAAFDFTKYPLQCINSNGLNILSDIRSKFYNVINSYRMTTDNPQSFTNKIYLFGNCTAVGTFAEDQHTIASHLQRLLNNLFPNTFCVCNPANWCDFSVTSRQIISPIYDFKPDDILIILTHNANKQYIDNSLALFTDNSFVTFIDDIPQLFDRPHSHGDIFFDTGVHMGPRGYKILATHIASHICKVLEPENVAIQSTIYDSAYIAYLKSIRKTLRSGAQIGAVVMNCNPFTRGHRYLIEEALKKCDFLYLFIVEEDKSYFSFADRLEMAKKGTEDLKNILIVRSGKMLLSVATLPEYFAKDSEKEIQIDPSLDLTIFADEIAKLLGITRRFAGTEPYCPVTNQYNKGMRELLPKKGIEFIEIPRIAELSATKVRKILSDEDCANVKNYVPETTYDYLVKLKNSQPVKI